MVEAGATLIRLDETATRAAVRRLELKLFAALAQRARLAAEHEGSDEVVWPDLLLDNRDDPKVADIIAAQSAEFAARRDKTVSEVAVVERRANGAREEMEGLEAQLEAAATQLEIIGREFEATETLYKQGYTTLNRLLALQRSHAQLKGDHGQLTAQIARAREQVAEHDGEIARLKSEKRGSCPGTVARGRGPDPPMWKSRSGQPVPYSTGSRSGRRSRVWWCH